MLLQLEGRKTVSLLPPEAVGSVRPDPTSKHWPRAGAAELRAARLELGWWARLEPGDQLFVPLMWFHAVEAPDAWTATANRYYHRAESASQPRNEAAWRELLERRKHPEWLRYEKESGVLLC